MKKTILILTALASLTIATTEITQAATTNAKVVDARTFFSGAKAVDAWAFFSGAYLGMTIKKYNAYYAPIADTAFEYGGAPDGQRYVDFRSYGSAERYHDWRVLVHYRESDGIIVAIEYWNASGKFSSEMIRHLKDINKEWAGLITELYDDGYGAEFVATTAAQDKLESDVFKIYRDTKHIVSSDAMAVFDIGAFNDLIRSLEVALNLSKVTASFVFEESGLLIDPGTKDGTLIIIPSGATIIVHKVIPMPKSGISMALITYQGRDLIMPVFKDSFAK